MAQLSIEELEELILTRDSYLHEAQASGRALAELTTQNNWRRGEIDSLREQLAAKDAEIARLTAQLNAAPQPAQEQADATPFDTMSVTDGAPGNGLYNALADEHPAKKGWVEIPITGEGWEWQWQPRPANERDWKRAVFFWDLYQPEIIAAYDRYTAQQEGGQAQ